LAGRQDEANRTPVGLTGHGEKENPIQPEPDNL
jgi:hypothetical protein